MNQPYNYDLTTTTATTMTVEAELLAVAIDYMMDWEEAMLLSELVFAYLATTTGPRTHRLAHGWTPEIRLSIARLIQSCCRAPSVVGVALIYIGHLKCLHLSLEVTGSGALNMFIVALKLAFMMVVDTEGEIKNELWVKDNEERLTSKQLARLELELLSGLGWDTSLQNSVAHDFLQLEVGWMEKQTEVTSEGGDWFVEVAWEGSRPMAFEFFDGLSKDKEHQYAFVPNSPINTVDALQGSPEFHDLAETIWDSVKPGVDPVSIWPDALDVLEAPDSDSASCILPNPSPSLYPYTSLTPYYFSFSASLPTSPSHSPSLTTFVDTLLNSLSRSQSGAASCRLRAYGMDKMRHPEQYASFDDLTLEDQILSDSASKRFGEKASKWVGEIEASGDPEEMEQWMIKERSYEIGAVVPIEHMEASSGDADERLKNSMCYVLDLLHVGNGRATD